MFAQRNRFVLAVFLSVTVHAGLLLVPAAFRIQGPTGNRVDVLPVTLKPPHVRTIETQEPPEQLGQMRPSSKGIQRTSHHEATVSLGNRDSRYRDYLSRVKVRIDKRWIYPGQAFERGEKGVTTVRFSIGADGSLMDQRVTESSGYDLLDETAVNVVKAAAPYDPLPDSLGLSCLHIIASFHYNLIR